MACSISLLLCQISICTGLCNLLWQDGFRFGGWNELGNHDDDSHHLLRAFLDYWIFHLHRLSIGDDEKGECDNQTSQPIMFKKLLNIPVSASEHGGEVDFFIILIHGLMAFLLVGWLAYFLYVLWRFRASKNPKADPIGAKTHASTYLEGLVAFIETVLLIGFAVPLWKNMVDEIPQNTNEVRVMAEQFGWKFMYPGPDKSFGKQDLKLVNADNKLGRVPDDPAGRDDFITLNDLRVPVGLPTVFHVSSLDVVHSFKITTLRICQDATPGHSVPTWCKPEREGRYQISCAQLCGSGHTAMTQGFLTVQKPEDFDAWVAELAQNQ